MGILPMLDLATFEHGGDKLRYPLRAWIEGHYARDHGVPLDENPCLSDVAMATAWSSGWCERDKMGDPMQSIERFGRTGAS